MTLEIVEIDPYDEAQYADYYAVYAAAERADRGEDADTWTLTEARAELRQKSSTMQRSAYAGLDDGVLVVAAWLALPLKDNLHRANLGLYVAPIARRHGHGTAMLGRLEQEARRQGRTVVGAEVYWPYADSPDGSGAAGVEFARRHGYELALTDVRRRLSLPVDDALLDRLAREAARHHSAYTLRSWVGPVPDDLVEGWAALDASLETQAPTGGLDIEPMTPDVASVRETEELFDEQGRTPIDTVAVARAGTVVAYSQIVVDHSNRAFQWGTLVRPQDRGHRLGIAVKAANLGLLQRERPDVTSVTTYNAEINAHMVAVNDALGYVPIERLGELQKRL